MYTTTTLIIWRTNNNKTRYCSDAGLSVVSADGMLKDEEKRVPSKREKFMYV